ncbi:hypothetical protein ACFLSJ_07295 [Verrucomicrobiota bacterium]
MKKVAVVSVVFALVAVWFAESGERTEPERTMRFDNAPLSVVLETYQKMVGKEVLIRAGVHATFHFRGGGGADACLEAIQRHLSREDVILVPEGNDRLIAEWKHSRRKRDKKPDTPPVVTKYDKMEKKQLQEELKRLQAEVLVAERTVTQAKEKAAEAENACKSASDDEKPDALLRMIEAGVAEEKAKRPYHQIKGDFQAARRAYAQLLMNE